MGKIRVIQQHNGETISFLTKDKGKPGATPESEQWYNPQVQDTGWKKDLPEEKRRALMLQAHKGDVRAAGRAMVALANVTTDIETSRAARSDALYFFRQLRKPYESPTKHHRRITPPMPRLR